MRARTADARMCALICALMWVRVRARTQPRRTVQALPVGVDRVRLGAQAFYSASAFNANIGAWNTASVSNMANVCAAFHQRRPMRRTRSIGL
jgi:surface protein